MIGTVSVMIIDYGYRLLAVNCRRYSGQDDDSRPWLCAEGLGLS